MNETQTGSILINLVDGTQQPLSNSVKWSARIHDGRPPDQWQMVNVAGAGSAELVRGLRYFDNLFDSYTVIVNANGYEDAGWMPVHISPARPAPVDLMLLPKDSHLNFSGATWKALNSLRPRFAEILSAGISDAPARYSNLTEQPDGLVLGCLLNLLTAMSQITLPSAKSPLDYYWQPIWDDPLFKMAQDRFFAYVDKALVDDVVKAGKQGSFAEEKNPGALHPGATLSYKQTQFDVTNVQLTFHQRNPKTLDGPNGPVDCIVLEPDIDYYKDLLAHFFIEVLPNKFTGGLTDPRAVYVLRWMAGKQAGSEFNPLYTMTT
ncbi:MAG: hypothetical protein WCD68_20850 [Candidatus Acidiferrum sp.]